MSLPPLLLERLRKRGLIQEVDQQDTKEKLTKKAKKNRKTDDVHDEQLKSSLDQDEEIIAEDYSEEVYQEERDKELAEADDEHRERSLVKKSPSPATTVESGQDACIGSVLGCPNKYNIYHSCSKYCLNTYGQLEDTNPSLEHRKYLLVLLRAYPLPPDWSIVYDPGLKSFYFWDTRSDLVSWLPPTAGYQISPSVENLKKSIIDSSMS